MCVCVNKYSQETNCPNNSPPINCN